MLTADFRLPASHPQGGQVNGCTRRQPPPGARFLFGCFRLGLSAKRITSTYVGGVWCLWREKKSWLDKTDEWIMTKSAKKLRHILCPTLFLSHFEHAAFTPMLAECLKTLPPPSLPYVPTMECAKARPE